MPAKFIGKVGGRTTDQEIRVNDEGCDCGTQQCDHIRLDAIQYVCREEDAELNFYLTPKQARKLAKLLLKVSED